MDQNERRVRKNQLRRGQRTKMRQDSLSIEYIRLKYNDIYTEAIEFYNSVNKKYPEKYDLRKTEEFKVLKSDMARIEKPIEQVPRPQTPDFPNPPTPIRLRFGERCIYKDNLQLRIPLMSPETVTTEIIQEGTIHTPPVTTEIIQEGTVHTPPVTTEIIQEGTVHTPPVTTEIIQEGTVHTPPVTTEIIQEGTVHTPPVTTEIIQEGTVHTPPVTTEIIQEGTVHTPPVTTEIIQEGTVHTPPVTTEIIQEGTVHTPPVTTEILPMVVDEILEDTIQPSLFDELDPQLIQKIIDDLRGDPDLKDIMTNIEQEVEYEELGMDID